MAQDRNYTFMKVLRAVVVAAMLLLVNGTAMADGDKPLVHGSVYGGGNNADVQVNTEVNISAGTVEGNVYGGGNLGDVGTIVKNTTDYNYTWTGNTANNNNITGTNNNTGICTVTISGGTIGQGTSDERHGNVFGGGRGEANTFWCEKGIVYATSVSISAGTVNGSVYGGGEVGRVEDDTKVTIGEGTSGPTIKGNVFGAGAGKKTHGYSALVRGNSVVVVQAGAKVKQNVYGGGQVATVGKFWVTGVDYPAALNPPTAPTDLPDGMPYAWRAGGVCRVTVQGSAEITGDVFGAGKGQEPDVFPTHYESITDPNDPQKTIKVEYYTTKAASEVGDIDNRMPKRMVNYEAYNETTKKGFKDADKNITWVPFDDEDNPTIVWEYFDTPEKYYTFLQTLAIIDKPITIINGSAEINGSVFGGSESGFVLDETSVSIQGGTIGTTTTGGDVFGGGKGLLSFAEAGRVRKNTNLSITNGAILGNVYGGGSLGDVGTITKPADYNYLWKQTDGSTANVTEYNVPSSSTHKTENNTGICTVYISGGTIGAQGKSTENHASGHVFGAGRGSETTWWCEKAIAYATKVTVSAGTVYGNVYGGGQVGRVEDDAKVTIGTAGTPASGTEGEEGYVAAVPASGPDIKGDVYGAGAGLETHGYSALVRGNALVTVQGTSQVGGSVYGGGEIASVGKFVVVGGLPTKPSSGGTCIVNIKDNAKIGTSGTTHHVFGACKGVTPHYDSSTPTSYKSVYSMQTYENRPSDTPGNTWDYWKTYDQGYEGQKFIKRYYTTEQDYLDFLKTLALTSNPHVTIGGTWTPNETTGTITVSGTPYVYGSVYGGGQRGVTLGAVDVNMIGGTVEQDVYGGGALADTNLGNWDVNNYVEATSLNEGESITDLYTRTGTEGSYKYTKVTDANATISGGTYYRRVPTWAHEEKSAYYTTTVDLTGGLIKGDAYGGGLGQKVGFNSATTNIEAVVWGDIALTLDGTAFNINKYTDPGYTDVIKSGRVFGCNNLLGSPQGNVTVTVNQTVEGNTPRTEYEEDGEGNVTKDKRKSETASDHTYELAAVYGGGNLAPYTAKGMKTHVVIHGCKATSILTVYGGGNAAAVPETDVDIYSAFEIGSVFGGGNGKDKYKNDAGWQTNPGANVNGDVNTLIYGGTVHEAYGASNEKGTITGNVSIDVSDTNPENCPLDVAKIVGAGRNADIDGNLIVVVGCKPTTKIPLYYGGADNANVNGNVELTITSGNFGKVFGGNNEGGAIRGHIVLNIEESSTCGTPITIDELYLGGNQAAYSIYGYYVKTTTSEGDGTGVGANTETAVLNDDRLVFMPRQSASDRHKPVKSYRYDEEHSKWTWEVYAGTEGDKFTPYDQPVLNIVSCSRIDEVFGGGYGTGAAMYADPTVNINMIASGNTAGTGVITNLMTAKNLPNTENTDKLGVIGDVFGGGNAADVIGNPTVNIGTASKVKLHLSVDKNGTYSWGDEQDVVGAYIIGDVFGGGKGEATTFKCEKAMIGKDGDGLIDPNGGTTVNIFKGTVRGNVYGGGKIGRVEKNTNVTIGTGDGVAPAPGSTPTSAPVIMGSVFGGGAGEEEHGYAALVRGNPTVIIQGNAKVGRSVYGGGEIASVARYKVAEDAVEAAAHGVEVDMPYVLDDPENPSGICNVTVRGYAEIGTDNMKMYHKDGSENIPATDKPDDWGYVFGAGKGVLPSTDYSYQNNNTRPKRMLLYDSETIKTITYWAWVDEANQNTNKNIWQYFKDLDEYIGFIQTLALATKTNVTIGGHAFVKGSVYGGSENGLVQFDTDVKIQDDCQIGAGDGVNRRYTDDEWNSESLAECASWEYESPYAPYDPYANATGDLDKYPKVDAQDAAKSTEGGRRIASDGHTYYGNVFGGGSGSIPYFDVHEGISKYLNSAGQVKGDTKVTISGGHILTNVYGGCEATNVLGKATVTMTNGTVGVPRTDAQIIAHPLTGYVFGAGKGDQRIYFNKDTNVENAIVEIKGGRIYGSVYGGGEDGHVLKNVEVTIEGSSTKIGTKGTSYYDGNVFGGGRGFGGEALTAGNVSGSVKLNIKDGKILGSVYGGGRLASVGYGLYLTTENYFGESRNDGYGKMQEDGYSDWTKGANNQYSRTEISGFKRGYIDIDISGGTIGNDVADAVYGGNVFGGSMGSLKKQDGTTDNDLWNLLATAKKTTVEVSGGTIKRNVYGGGEMGTVTTDAIVTISGGTIGTAGNEDEGFGNVYCGGKGATEQALAGIINGNTTLTIGQDDGKTTLISQSVYGGGEAGLVRGKVEVEMNGGTVQHDVYGGGALANTNIDNGTTSVNLHGGVIGHNVYGGGLGRMEIQAQPAVDPVGEEGQEGYIPGKPAVEYVAGIAAKVYGDVTVNLNEDDTDNCVVQGNIFGCNNLNGTPLGSVTVHVYKTEDWTGHAKTSDELLTDPDGTKHSYNVAAVYGGGNLAAYVPLKALSSNAADKESIFPHVIIEGCGLTSIRQVYGGGNAASTPSTKVEILGTYEIEEVFGGGNGKDDIVVNGETKDNPGANVGFYDYSSVENTYDTKEKRQTESAFLNNYVYGSGKANVDIKGGTIHRVFGGSNTKGNVRQTAVTMLAEESGCPFCVDEAYGGGKSAPMDAEAKLLMSCIPGLKVAYGGAEAADIMGDVSLNITNGTFDRVFGGNNISGTIRGAITVNIEETGCKPIIIGELYGGGNLAGYSVYGYDSNNNPIESGATPLYNNPQVNVKSFTSIGDIYGGGYGTSATMVANPRVNVNVALGDWANDDRSVFDENSTTTGGYPVPSHAKTKIGAINNVFGGGNAAPVIGNTYVNIGNETDVYVTKEVAENTTFSENDNYYTRTGSGTTTNPYVYTKATGTANSSITYYQKLTVVGADIRGNVYGGGNKAEVTGNTNVTIGREGSAQ